MQKENAIISLVQRDQECVNARETSISWVQRRDTQWGVHNSIWNQKSLTLYGGLRNFTRAREIRSRCKMVTEVCPEVPWWMQCQAFIYELLKFMLLFGVYAEFRIQGQKDWVGVLALHSPAQWTWKTLTLSGLWGIFCNLGTIFILWTAVVMVRWSPGSKSTLQMPWC